MPKKKIDQKNYIGASGYRTPEAAASSGAGNSPNRSRNLYGLHLGFVLLEMVLEPFGYAHVELGNWLVSKIATRTGRGAGLSCSQHTRVTRTR